MRRYPLWLVALLVLLTPMAAASATLSGTVTCGDCVGGIGVVAQVEDLDFEVAASRWLASAGPFELTVVDDLGEVSLFAFRDADANGIPDAGTPSVPYTANPLTVASDDLTGIALDLGTVTLSSVHLTGTVACADCVGGIVVFARLREDDGGALLAQQRLAGPGAFALAVPVEAGETDLFAFRDIDGNGVADPGTPLVPHADNPIVITGTDVVVAPLNLGAVLLDAIWLEGTVECGDCAGGVGVVVVPRDGDFAFVATTLAVPGVYRLAVPAEAGSVDVLGYRDVEGDGVPDFGTPLVPYAENPVSVGNSDLDGVDLDLGIVTLATIGVSGTVTCDDCVGPVGVRVDAADPLVGRLAHLRLPRPGAYSLRVETEVGEVLVTAYRDLDGNGLADPGTASVPFAGNPLTVTDVDLAGIDVDLGRATLPTVRVSGQVTCADCPGGVAVDALLVEDGELLTQVGLGAPGPYALDLPADIGAVALRVYRDLDRNGRADPGTPTVPWADNPLPVEGMDRTGVDFDLGRVTLETVRLSGTVSCGDCRGGVAVRVDAGDDLVSVSVAVPLEAPGPWTADVPVDTGDVWVTAYRDEDDDGAPDFGTLIAHYAGNPLTIATDDISGIDLDLGLARVPVVTVSGSVLCGDCPGGIGLLLVERFFGEPVAGASVPGPGAFSLIVPAEAGEADLFAFRDLESDGVPDPGCLVMPWPSNPLVIGADDVSDVEIDISICVPTGSLGPADESDVDAGDADDAGLDALDGDLTDPLDDVGDGGDSEDAAADLDEPGGDDGCGCSSSRSGPQRPLPFEILAALIGLFVRRRR